MEKVLDSEVPAAVPKWKKIVKTSFLIFTWICLGLTLEITGPTLKDLRLKTDGSYEDVSRAISGRSVGFFIGAAIGGVLVDKLHPFCNLMIAICLDGIAVVTTIAPNMTSVNVVWALFVLAGTFEGVINISGQKLILDMWLDKASSPMHALHLGFGIGSFIVPEIANPFLAEPAPTLSSSGVNTTTNRTYNFISSMSSRPTTFHPTPTSKPLSTTIEYVKGSRIEWAYLIVSIITAVTSLVFYFYQYNDRKTKTNSTKNDDTNMSEKRPGNHVVSQQNRFVNTLKSFVKIANPGSCTGGRKMYGVVIFMFLFLYFFTVVGGERIYGKFLRTYAIDELNFNGDDATLLNTAFWISFSGGRFAGFVTARWIPIRTLMIIEACGCLVSAAILNFFAYNNSTLLWVFSMPMGFFIAPLFPTGIAWGDFHVEMTGMAITFCLLGGALGGMSYMWVIGYLYDNYGYRTFLYLTGGFGGFIVLFAFILLFIGCGQGNRFEKKEEDSENEVENTKI
ncbi:sodium-dependent glucose transporter 1B-like [Ylistrum balloti]|uniref:sodium-dependent glucose transporter 1B-like n=1 Tax=Ylistrum balloti TaxID=509963 RepID=UPI002905F57C|nr:sodium-dependent glucose transporter 1B-like [Ylistrum balloti]